MAFEIKSHLEVKIDGQWHHYSVPSIVRNYKLFSLLGFDFTHRGIPNRKDTITSKGLPEDCSYITKLSYNPQECFYPSWINVEELNKVIASFSELSSFNYDELPKMRNLLGYLFDNSVEKFIEHREDYPQFLEDVRIVFWFK